MRISFVRTICSMTIGILALSAPVIAQQKTESACQQEWRANKAANQAKGITGKGLRRNMSRWRRDGAGCTSCSCDSV
jgi:hypothetical protein